MYKGSSLFDKSGDNENEYVYDDQGDLEEVEEVENVKAEVVEKAEPDVPVTPSVAKEDRRGRIAGGSDYVYYGDF